MAAPPRFLASRLPSSPRPDSTAARAITSTLFEQLTVVFLAYFLAGKLGQTTTSIRSSNLGPVWPAYGIALAACLAYASAWPAVAVSAFLVALGSVTPAAA